MEFPGNDYAPNHPNPNNALQLIVSISKVSRVIYQTVVYDIK